MIFALLWLQTFGDEILELPQWMRIEQRSCETEMKIARQHKPWSSTCKGIKFDLHNESKRDEMAPSKEDTFQLQIETLSSS
jgi:hypothetical protein